MKSWGLAAIAFLGADLLRYTPVAHDQQQMQSVVRIGIATAGLVFVAWNTVSLLYVEPSRLAETSIPHILTAKSVLGQHGRQIIGIVVIAGACAAVNLLFNSVARMTVAMAATDLFPNILGNTPSRPWPVLVAMTGLTSLLMSFGFAGSELLDVSLRAGLILWLASRGLNHFIQLAFCRELKQKNQKSLRISRPLLHLLLFTSMSSMAGVLIYTDDDPATLLRALLILLALAAGLAAAGRLIATRGPEYKSRNPSKLAKGALR